MTNIYIIKNKINNIVYIGQTKFPIYKRFIEHLYGSIKQTTKPLYIAMDAIGQENFYIELLEICNDDVANIRENYYIDLYPNNYNEHYNFPLSKELLEKELNTLSLREIAMKYNIKEKATVRYWAKKWGLNTSIKNKLYTELTKNLLFEEYIINNLSTKEIAKKYNVKSVTTIKTRLKKYNINKLTINESNSVNTLTDKAEGNTELSSIEKV